MSSKIRIALRRGHAYLQSPIDDLESFYHVFVWAILHNVHWQRLLSEAEEDCRGMLSGTWLSGTWSDREGAQKELRCAMTTSPVLGSDLQGLLKAWKATQDYLEDKWEQIERILQYLRADNFFTASKVTEQNFRKWTWHLIAFEGVRRILMDMFDRSCSFSTPEISRVTFHSVSCLSLSFYFSLLLSNCIRALVSAFLVQCSCPLLVCDTCNGFVLFTSECSYMYIYINPSTRHSATIEMVGREKWQRTFTDARPSHAGREN